jgi:hypothetical protein
VITTTETDREALIRRAQERYSSKSGST